MERHISEAPEEVRSFDGDNSPKDFPLGVVAFSFEGWSLIPRMTKTKRYSSSSASQWQSDEEYGSKDIETTYRNWFFECHGPEVVTTFRDNKFDPGNDFPLTAKVVRWTSDRDVVVRGLFPFHTTEIGEGGRIVREFASVEEAEMSLPYDIRFYKGDLEGDFPPGSVITVVLHEGRKQNHLRAEGQNEQNQI